MSAHIPTEEDYKRIAKKKYMKDLEKELSKHHSSGPNWKIVTLGVGLGILGMESMSYKNSNNKLKKKKTS